MRSLSFITVMKLSAIVTEILVLPEKGMRLPVSFASILIDP